MKITQELLDKLTAQAKESPRLRMNFDLRNSADDGSQRMLNAIEPGSPLPIHRHRGSSETVVCLRGRLVEEFYDDAGKCTETVELAPGGPVVAWCCAVRSSPLPRFRDARRGAASDGRLHAAERAAPARRPADASTARPGVFAAAPPSPEGSGRKRRCARRVRLRGEGRVV